MKKLIAAVMALAGTTLVASCSTASAQPERTSKASAELAKALQGRAAGPAQRCIPNWRASNMRIIDDWTILFRDGKTVYVQNPRGGCPGIGNGRNTLVTRLWGTGQLCSGDISQLVDLSTGIGGGACVFSDFVPYTRP
jgi:hypothetical protein